MSDKKFNLPHRITGIDNNTALLLDNDLIEIERYIVFNQKRLDQLEKDLKEFKKDTEERFDQLEKDLKEFKKDTEEMFEQISEEIAQGFKEANDRLDNMGVFNM